MRLADFIAENAEAILAEWVAFAATLGPAGEEMDLAALRDHAAEMLTYVVVDLRTPQTNAQQEEKAKGNAPISEDSAETAAEVHGSGRAESGFTIGEMVSEYRALRASVIRLWTKANGTLNDGTDLEDLMRFNEAIDQSLAESVTRYTRDLDHSKEMFLAILGHDLRSPLGTVITSSQFMLDTGALAEPHLTLAQRIASASRRMNNLVGDLLDFTRSRLGSGVPIVRADMDLARAVCETVDEVAAAHPEGRLTCRTSGDLHGAWDSARMKQVIANLVGNAVQYGDATTPISVTVRGEPNEVVIEVHNRGSVIPARQLRELFNPLKRLNDSDATSPSSSLGLGLYITERIVTAHSGTIDVHSAAENGTTFSIHLPR
jgi:signal transduction histidine kinase